MPDNHRWVHSSALEAAARDDKRGRAAGALRDAIGARVDVERAVGVVMNQNDCDASVAFRELETRSAANSDNILM
ncbi:ANTAR domain-containing protein [Rhodococcus sp. AD45-ID]|nr:ANTAR domain-containing protein [Rhodococcus sp. AD45-ID]